MQLTICYLQVLLKRNSGLHQLAKPYVYYDPSWIRLFSPKSIDLRRGTLALESEVPPFLACSLHKRSYGYAKRTGVIANMPTRPTLDPSLAVDLHCAGLSLLPSIAWARSGPGISNFESR